MAVTNDEYELPVYIEESYLAMAKKSGVSHPTILRQCKGRSRSSGKIKFVEINVEP